MLCRGPLLSEAEPRSTAWVDPGVGPTTGCRAPGNARSPRFSGSVLTSGIAVFSFWGGPCLESEGDASLCLCGPAPPGAAQDPGHLGTGWARPGPQLREDGRASRLRCTAAGARVAPNVGGASPRLMFLGRKVSQGPHARPRGLHPASSSVA